MGDSSADQHNDQKYPACSGGEQKAASNCAKLVLSNWKRAPKHPRNTSGHAVLVQALKQRSPAVVGQQAESSRTQQPGLSWLVVCRARISTNKHHLGSHEPRLTCTFFWPCYEVIFLNRKPRYVPSRVLGSVSPVFISTSSGIKQLVLSI